MGCGKNKKKSTWDKSDAFRSLKSADTLFGKPRSERVTRTKDRYSEDGVVVSHSCFFLQLKSVVPARKTNLQFIFVRRVSLRERTNCYIGGLLPVALTREWTAFSHHAFGLWCRSRWPSASTECEWPQKPVPILEPFLWQIRPLQRLLLSYRDNICFFFVSTKKCFSLFCLIFSKFQLTSTRLKSTSTATCTNSLRLFEI